MREKSETEKALDLLAAALIRLAGTLHEEMQDPPDWLEAVANVNPEFWVDGFEEILELEKEVGNEPEE